MEQKWSKNLFPAKAPEQSQPPIPTAHPVARKSGHNLSSVRPLPGADQHFPTALLTFAVSSLHRKHARIQHAKSIRRKAVSRTPSKASSGRRDQQRQRQNRHTS
jgi:hypothetical protein